MKRVLFGLLAAIVLAASIGYAFRRPITLPIVENPVASTLGSDLLRELPDGLHVARSG